MNKNWNDIKWIFEPDGSLRDIYVQEVSLIDWIQLIDFLNDSYTLNYDSSNRIDKVDVVNYLKDESGEMESKSVYINLEGITIACHFFLIDQIEFDIDPKEIKSLNDYKKVEAFMNSVSKILSNQVTLTGENSPKFPLIKIDIANNTCRILTESESRKFLQQSDSIEKQLSGLKIRFMMELSRNKFEEKMLKSADQPYQSTKKSENIW